MTAKPRLARCMFKPSGRSVPAAKTGQPDVRICLCGCLETDAIHRTTELSDEQRAAQARRIGDR